MKEFEFKQQIGKKGFYCRVQYEIEIFDDAYYYIDCGASNKWANTINFSGSYFFEKFSGYKKRGFRLKIHNVNDMIIDTSQMVVFYTIIKLLMQETGHVITDLNLNENGAFVIPK